MSTAILQKTPVEAKWNTQKLHEETATLFARQMVATMTTLAKYGPEAQQELMKNIVAGKVEHFKAAGVQTPIDLVRAMAESEANLFGSKIQIVGDEKKAEMIYDQCACWNAIQKVGKLTPEQEEAMGKNFEAKVRLIGQAFGLKGEVKFEGETAIVTFTK